MSYISIPQRCSQILDPVSRPCVRDQQRHRALRPISPEDANKLALLQNGRFLIEGIRNRDLQPDWPEPADGPDAAKRTAAKITRWLRLIAAHSLITIVPKSHCYSLTQKGQNVITLATSIRQANLLKLAS